MTRMHFGVNPHLEAEADAIIRAATVKQRAAEKTDILTPWKADNRRRHEVYPNGGIADSSVRQGMYERASNPTSPHLNSTDGHAPALGRGTVHGVGYDRSFSLHDFIERELDSE